VPQIPNRFSVKELQIYYPAIHSNYRLANRSANQKWDCGARPDFLWPYRTFYWNLYMRSPGKGSSRRNPWRCSINEIPKLLPFSPPAAAPQCSAQRIIWTLRSGFRASYISGVDDDDCLIWPYLLREGRNACWICSSFEILFYSLLRGSGKKSWQCGAFCWNQRTSGKQALPLGIRECSSICSKPQNGSFVRKSQFGSTVKAPRFNS